MNYYVTGFIGSDRKGEAMRIADEKGLQFIDMNEAIKDRDGRSVMRIVMSMGEHALHNAEYELLQELDTMDGLVVSCGDGTLFDGDCAEIMEHGRIVIADADRTPEQLWEAAKDDDSIPYAFMLERDDRAREKFMSLYEQRRSLYEKYL
ncbi:MAG: shikimate kinase [Anaerovoracaceae bacterium]|nr:shikimate kinase [Anaerovoracaceae bacterium]